MPSFHDVKHDTIDDLVKITRHCTGVCDKHDCPLYKHSNPTWCLAMNIKELLDTIESQKEVDNGTERTID